MTIIAEDNTGLPDANSYSALADADAYHLARGNDDWSDALPSEREAALIRATDYIDAFYQANGTRLVATQALQWPVAPEVWSSPLTDGVYGLEWAYDLGLPFYTSQYSLYTAPTAVVPAPVRQATMLLALYALAGPLASPLVDRGTKKIEQKLDGVGLLITEYDATVNEDRYPLVTKMLRPFASVPGGLYIGSLAR